MMSGLEWDTRDRESDRRVLLVVSGTLLSAFGIGAAVQTVFALRVDAAGLAGPVGLTMEAGLRIGINLASVAFALVIVGLVKLNERPLRQRVLWTAVIAMMTALLRFAVQLAARVYDHATWEVALTEVLSVFVVVTMAVSFGSIQVQARMRLRMQERRSARQALRAAEALEALATEELRVRREVAENLHGTVQNRLLIAGMTLESIIERTRGEVVEADLHRLRAELADIREREVRQTSHLLYPAGVSVGVAHAIRLLVQRLPPTIAAEIVIDPQLASGDSLEMRRRVLLVRVAEEAITNALKHGSAGAISMSLTQGIDGIMQLSIGDDGIGFGGRGPGGTGLARLSERAAALGGSLMLREQETGRTELRLSLPL